MANFSLFETFFFLTLAITFILILLLVYHFKDRLSKLEQKSDRMFEIIQGLSEEISSHQNDNKVILGPSLEQYNLNSSTMAVLEEPEFDVRKIENIDLNINNEEESSDEEEDEITVLESESESECESECESEDDKTTIEKIDIPNMEEVTIDYKKLPVAELRDIVTKRGLSDNANKLKKGELVELLQQ